MKISEQGKNLIKGFEGLKLKAYICPAGIPTIGYGHTGFKSLDTEITEAEANKLLEEDLVRFEDAVRGIKKELKQNQFDALVSFAFNVGVRNFNSSTLKRKVCINPDDESIKNEFGKWIKAKGKRSNGLVKRREAEAELYFKK